jgi:hypothetical protein
MIFVLALPSGRGNRRGVIPFVQFKYTGKYKHYPTQLFYSFVLTKEHQVSTANSKDHLSPFLTRRVQPPILLFSGHAPLKGKITADEPLCAREE